MLRRRSQSSEDQEFHEFLQGCVDGVQVGSAQTGGPASKPLQFSVDDGAAVMVDLSDQMGVGITAALRGATSRPRGVGACGVAFWLHDYP